DRLELLGGEKSLQEHYRALFARAAQLERSLQLDEREAFGRGERPDCAREAVTVGVRLHHRADARTRCTPPRRVQVVAERGGIDADSDGAHGSPFDHKTGISGEQSSRSLRTRQMTHGIKRAAKGVP